MCSRVFLLQSIRISCAPSKHRPSNLRDINRPSKAEEWVRSRTDCATRGGGCDAPVERVRARTGRGFTDGQDRRLGVQPDFLNLRPDVWFFCRFLHGQLNRLKIILCEISALSANPTEKATEKLITKTRKFRKHEIQKAHRHLVCDVLCFAPLTCTARPVYLVTPVDATGAARTDGSGSKSRHKIGGLP
jgi:hypothetical protein